MPTKRVLPGSALAAAVAISVHAQPARPAPIVSPQVNADKTVTLRFRAPNSRSVELIGELEGKPSYPMTKDEATGVWPVTIGPLPHDVYNYQFRVDAANGQGGISGLKPGATQRSKSASRSIEICR